MPIQQFNGQPAQFIQSLQMITTTQPINGLQLQTTFTTQQNCFPQYSGTYASYQGQQPMNITSTIHKKEEI